jgi:hypothetical protein
VHFVCNIGWFTRGAGCRITASSVDTALRKKSGVAGVQELQKKEIRSVYVLASMTMGSTPELLNS